MIQLNLLSNSNKISDLKKAYLKTLIAPLDGYWQAAIIDPAPHWEMLVNGRCAGYFAASYDKRLLQFYVADDFLQQVGKLFATVIGSEWVETAVASTIDPVALSLCLDVQKQVSVSTYLFQDLRRGRQDLPVYLEAEFRLSTLQDLDILLDFHGRNNEFEDTDAIESNFGNHRNYVLSLIEQKQSFGLYNREELLGTGEYRINKNQPPFADIGMIVDRKYRRQGIGAWILTQLKAYCYSQNTVPICSCAVENIVSRKTIEKAGFVSHHRIVDIQF
ncbi:MAG: GNAT family N-acetyltransferase [Hyphomicrobiales bacterium]|nr:GNAT family N-acetyltransferase [Hyphomicrobiales bacterium]